MGDSPVLYTNMPAGNYTIFQMGLPLDYDLAGEVRSGEEFVPC